MKKHLKVLGISLKISVSTFLAFYLCESFYYLSFDLREFSNSARGTAACVSILFFTLPLFIALTSDEK